VSVLILCAVAIAISKAYDDKPPIAVQFVKCSGECGREVMLIGRKRRFGECVFCKQCESIIKGAYHDEE